jgi:hypothetical protein
MKKLLLLSVIALTSCGKFKFENKIQGTWTMSEAKSSSMTEWFVVPSTEEKVVITESHISNPWNTTYTIVDKTIVFNNQTVKIDVKKDCMLWVFENTDSLRFIR